MRLRQEILLGIGGFHALVALGYEPVVGHINEGHAAFMSLARISHLMKTRGLDLETDGFERQNVAARIAIIGLWIAVTICAIGANLGEGEEIETTLFPLGLCAGGLLAVALGLSMATRGFSPVAIERDRAAGVRIASLFVASSVPLARAASGDWVSTEETVRDFAVAVPTLVALVVCAAVAEAWFTRARRNTPREGSLWAHGVLPATGYFFLVTAAWRFIR